MKKKLRPIILAGGVGKRLWPFSTESNPKQFIQVFRDLSLFDLTLQRINNSLFKKPIVVTSKRYLTYVKNAFERTGLEPYLTVLEPENKNTHAAVLLGVLLSSKGKKENFIVMPSDHYLSNNKRFIESCKRSLKEKGESLKLFGIKPEYPSPEYGYISFDKSNSKIKFIEKPTTRKARALIKEGNVYWNSGIFIFEKNWFIDESMHSNKILFNKINSSIRKGRREKNLFYPQGEAFSSIKKVSFDYGFVEKCKNISMIKLDAGWSDLGSWVSVMAQGSNETPFYEEETIKIERPWGFFQVLMETESSKVKLIRVMPRQKLSLQKHKHRSEKWFVVQGRAKVTKENEKFTLELGDSINIEKQEVHSLENQESSPLDIVEIQTGEYLGEDDIVRLEDIYGRVDLH